jgi:membrane-bound serine protease (ClpP class)
VALLAVGSPATAAERAPGADAACVVGVQLDGIVNAGMADYVEDALAEAREGPCGAVLLTVDTPGGRLTATRRITQALLGAPVPVIAHVAPSGARAGSAGMFIVMAAHVAAMAPGTNIGAAHPVVGLGKDPEEAGGEEMAQKVENDTAALARAIADERGRNADWAERAVRESVAATASEAAELGAVDRVARSSEALLDAIDGQTVRVSGEERALRTADAAVRAFDPSLGQRVLSFLGDPNVAYLLFTLGVLGLAVGIYSPELIFPAVIGVLCVILGAIGLEMLPVRPGAIALLVGAGLLFVAELFIASNGLLAGGGIAALVAGSLLLVDRDAPDFFADASVDVSIGLIVPLVVAASAVVIALVWLIARSHRRRGTTGVEAMVGETAEALTEVDASGGRVRLHGERWNATAQRPVRTGEQARVTGVRGLTLEITPLERTPKGESP